MQVGSYCLLDAEYLACQSRTSSRLFDGLPPLTMLSTIVSTTHSPRFVTIDCGLKAMYKDGATPEVLRPTLASGAGRLTYDWWGDEHGKLSVTNTDVSELKRASPAGRPPIDALSLTITPSSPSTSPIALADIRASLRLGQLVELSVSHCDPVINLHDHIYITKDDVVVDVWRIDARGKCQ